MKAKIYLSAVLISFLFLIKDAQGQGFLKADGKRIVNNNGNFLIRAMGLGGWMLQEPYMLQLSGAAGTQHEIKQKIKELVGAERTATFYREWLKNFITKGDIDSMAAWGFIYPAGR
jgi:endoglucanase